MAHIALDFVDASLHSPMVGSMLVFGEGMFLRIANCSSFTRWKFGPKCYNHP